MKRLTACMMALCLLLCAASAFAQAPAAGSLTATLESVRGNTSFTVESYPEIWITPIYAEYILQGKEDYPPDFLTFAPPEGAVPMEFSYDEALFINHDTLMLYAYYAYDRASFELFLEKAEPENTLADGSDGVAIFVIPDSRRARALVDISEYFDKTPKLEIILDDYSRDITTDQLTEMIQAEVDRVMSAMTLVTLDGYWSTDAYASVELTADSDPYTATVDATGLTMVKLESKRLEFQAAVEKSVEKTEIALDTYAYVYSKEDEMQPLTLSDGSEWVIYNTDYTGYAARIITEEGKHDRTLYLTIKIDCAPEAFPDLLDAMNARITITEDPT